MEERFTTFTTFTTLIAGISRCISRIKTEEMADYALRGSHVSCLYYLYKCGRMTARALGDICGEDKASISRAIKYLETEGYLCCAESRPKRYAAPLDLTARGREIAADIADRIDRILDRAAEGITAEQREVFYAVMRRIHGNLHDLCDAYN